MTDKQQSILDFIRACDEEGEPPPTLREIMDTVGISSTSVVNYELDALVSAGHITRNRTVSRGIRLAGKEGGEKTELAKLTRQLAEIVQVHQVQIADLQAEMKRLRQMVKQPAPSEADWQALNRAARQ